MSFFDSLIVEILGGVVAGVAVAIAAFWVLDRRFRLREQQKQSALAALGRLKDELRENSDLTNRSTSWPTFALTGREVLTPDVLSAIDRGLAKDLLTTYYVLGLLNRGAPANSAEKPKPEIMRQIREQLLEPAVEKVRKEHLRLAEQVLGPEWREFSRERHLEGTPLADLVAELENSDIGGAFDRQRLPGSRTGPA